MPSGPYCEYICPFQWDTLRRDDLFVLSASLGNLRPLPMLVVLKIG